MTTAWPLKYESTARCSTTKARVARMTLPHVVADLPMFMPVATSGVMKGVSVAQLQELGLHVILGNTYHLALQPGKDLMQDTYDGITGPPNGHR